MADTDHRCRSCGRALARDNTDGRCGPCQAADRSQPALPPVVPPEFWETDDMQAALRSRHMGKVIRAYRHHIHHGHGGLSQEDVARWVGSSQGKISRLETGPPLLRLDQLISWATLLGIPERHLWFKLPDDDSQLVPPTSAPAPRHPHDTPPSGPGPAPPQRDIADGGHIDHPPDLPPSERVDDDRRTEALVRSVAQHSSSHVDLTPTLPNPPIHIDIGTAQPARIADYLLGGSDNFTVDRDVIEHIISALPSGSETARATARASQAFQARTVRYLTRAGIRQFLRLGATLPTGVKTHEVAQEIAPESRVVYVISDDTVLAYAHRLTCGSAQGMVNYIRGDLRGPDNILNLAAETLDFDLPIAILLGSLYTGGDKDTTHRAVKQLIDGVPSGSYVVMVHLTTDILGSQMSEAVKRLIHAVQESKIRALPLSTHEEIQKFFEELELLEPGIVPIDKWHPEIPDEDKVATGNKTSVLMYGAVGRKP